jgi:cytochrome c oxidase subunit IV
MQQIGRTRTATAIVSGLLVGCAIWFWMFVLGFTDSYQDYFRGVVGPLVLAAVAACGLGALAPQSWVWTAITMSIPTIAMNLTCSSMAFKSQRVEGAYLWSAVLVLMISFAGAASGRIVKGKKRKPPGSGSPVVQRDKSG